MTVIDHAARAMRNAQLSLDGRMVMLRRGSYSTKVKAIRGEQRVDDLLQDGGVIVGKERNYLIDRDAYRFDGDRVRPRVGDQIIDDGITWAITETSNGEAWQWSDRNRQWYRVACKRVTV